MSATVEGHDERNGVVALRWAACFGLVLAVHFGVALFILDHVTASAEPPAGAPPPDAVMLDLPSEASTPPADPAPPEPQPPEQAPPEQAPPEVQPPEPQPPPEPPPPAPEPPPVAAPEPPPPPAPAPEVAVPLPPPPQPPPVEEPPVEKPPVRPPQAIRPVIPKPPTPRREVVRQLKSDQAAAPAAREAVQAPPAPVPAAPSSNAIPNWRSELIQRLQRAKRYPEAARVRDEQGVATVRFTMDRDGHVLSVDLVRSSGSEQLDQEAVAMFHRAEPLPPLPAEVSTNTLTLTVPITFSLQ